MTHPVTPAEDRTVGSIIRGRDRILVACVETQTEGTDG